MTEDKSVRESLFSCQDSKRVHKLVRILRSPDTLILTSHVELIGLMLKCCFTSTETVGLLGKGAQDIHLDFHTAPELCRPVGIEKEFISCSGCKEARRD